MVIAGYASDADSLIPRYETIDPAEQFSDILHLLPDTPARVLDLGAGTGRVAAWLAGMGHQITAVEPVAAFRVVGRGRHHAEAITWVEDRLPVLGQLEGAVPFDFVIAMAVLHHLDDPSRKAALIRMSQLVAPGGRVIISLRHGVGAATRPVFAPDPEQVIDQMAGLGLILIHRHRAISIQSANQTMGVMWDWLGFDLPG